MIARTVFRLGLAACFAGVSHLAMAQAVGTPEAQAAAAMDAGPKAKPQSNAPERKAAETSAKPAPTMAAAVAANADPVRKAAGGAAKPAPAPVVALDAVPSPATPDPLTPPEPNGPAPKAPGAEEAKPATTAQAPQPELDPLARHILAHVAKLGGRGDARDDVAGATAYYTENKGEAIWLSKDGFNQKAHRAIHEIRNANDWGLEASAFQLPSNPGSSLEAQAEAEVKLSLAVLKYARHARGGRLDPTSISPIIDRRPHIYDPNSVLEGISGANSADGYLRGLHPKNEQFKRLRQAYLALGKGSDSGSSASGNEEAGDSIFSNESRGGGGSMDEKRLRILVNMERWRWMPENLGEFYVWDSVPEQYTRIYDHGKVVLQERIVVGKPGTPTPTFSAPMQFITFNPEWGVPEGIKINEIAPRLKSSGGGGGGGAFLLFGGSGGGGGGGSSEVLQRLGGLRVSLNGKPVDPDSVDWSRVDIRRYTFTQGAGGKNVLGQVKFRFPNKHDVYMHDTVDRHLFGNGQRAFSHGCMRTQDPIHFAEVLLAHDRGMQSAQIREMVASGQTNEIALRNPIPVHIAYFTAEVDDKGQVHYFYDLYGLDNRVASALRGQPVQVASEPAPPSAATSASASEEDSEEQAESWAHPRHSNNRRPSAERRPWNPFTDWN